MNSRVVFCLVTLPYAKPDSEGYTLTCAKLGLTKAGCVVIKDTQTGLNAARAAGFACYVVQSNSSKHHKFTQADQVFTDLRAMQHYLSATGLV
ncbi:HAD-IA family hydrolase [Mucilaginibacter sp.]